MGYPEPEGLSAVTLAFLGDSVFELLVREQLIGDGSLPARVLHRKAVRKVNAAAQSAAYELLEAVLTDAERAILKRGRNANASKPPKSCTPEQYRKATAIEALFGYLHLKGETARIAELYGLMEAAQEDSP